MPRTIESTPRGTDLKVGVLVTLWYPEIVGRLRQGALETLRESGVRDEDVLVVEVPGAFELPQAAIWMARAGLVDAVVALGCVIRGETPHFEYVAGQAAAGCMRASQETGIPVGFGVITADTREQAEARSRAPAGGTSQKGGNKGIEAADAAVRMAASFRMLERGAP